MAFNRYLHVSPNLVPKVPISTASFLTATRTESDIIPHGWSRSFSFLILIAEI